MDQAAPAHQSASTALPRTPCKTQIWIAISVYVLVAIVKKKLRLEPSLYTLLQILCLTLFEKMPLKQAFADNATAPADPENSNQLSLQDF